MVPIKYVGRHSGGVTLVDGTECPHGEPVEVADDLAAQLLEQQPTQFKAVKARKQPAREAATEEE